MFLFACANRSRPLMAARGSIVLDSLPTAMLYSDRLPDCPPSAAVRRCVSLHVFSEEGVWCQPLGRPSLASCS